MNIVKTLKTIGRKPEPPAISALDEATAALEAEMLKQESELRESYATQVGIIATGGDEKPNKYFLASWMKSLNKSAGDLAKDVAIMKQWRLYTDGHCGFIATKKTLEAAADAANADYKKAKESVPEARRQMRATVNALVAHGAQARERRAFYGEHEELLRDSGEILELEV